MNSSRADKATIIGLAADALKNAPINGEWSQALELVALAAGGWGCSLLSSSKQKGILACALGGVSEQQIREGVAAGGLDPNINPRLNALRLSEPMRVKTEADFTHAMDWFASPFYQNFAARIDAPFSAFAKIDSAYDEITTVSVWRSADQGHAEADDTAVLTGLLPILRDALEIQRELDRRTLRFAAHAWDRSNTPAFYCDAHLRVLAMSTAGECAASSGAILQIKRNHLHLAAERQQRRLARAVAAASRQLSDATCEFKIETSSIDGTARAILAIAPISGEEAPALLSPAALVLLLQESTFAGRGETSPIVHLTKAEEDIGRLLLTGHTTRQIANARGSSISTVQTQIKVMNQKLNVGHRAQLLARLHDLFGEK